MGTLELHPAGTMHRDCFLCCSIKSVCVCPITCSPAVINVTHLSTVSRVHCWSKLAAKVSEGHTSSLPDCGNSDLSAHDPSHARQGSTGGWLTSRWLSLTVPTKLWWYFTCWLAGEEESRGFSDWRRSVWPDRALPRLLAWPRIRGHPRPQRPTVTPGVEYHAPRTDFF